MLAEQFHLRGVHHLVSAKTCHGAIGSGAGHALVHQIRKDRFVKRNKIVARILVNVNAYFFCRALGKHSSSRSVKGWCDVSSVRGTNQPA